MRYLIFLSFAFVLVGCSSQTRLDALQEEYEDLQFRVFVLEETLDKVFERLDDADDRITTLEIFK